MHSDGGEHEVCMVQKSFHKGAQTLLTLSGRKEKNFPSTSNMIISQSMQSNFAKLFAHVLLVV
jgi:hypothetical protein